MGKILAICTSPRRGTLKTPVPSAVLTPEWGIVGDAHGGSWHRQVSLLSAEKIEAFRQKLWVDYGAFGENLVVEGFDLATLPVPSFFAIGDAVLEMTQIGKECHSDCAIRRQTGDCIMPREGVFARVVKGGTIHTGDEMKLLHRNDCHNKIPPDIVLPPHTVICTVHRVPADCPQPKRAQKGIVMRV